MLAFGPVGVRALGPHELLVLVNRASPDSLAVANAYTRLNGIPPENVVFLELPESATAAGASISPDDFRRAIWDPAWKEIRARGLEAQILAWAYSAGFPVRVNTQPPVSIQGFTFVRTQLPPAEQIVTGQWASALFRGPAEPGGRRLPAVSLEQFRPALGINMPLPSMTLAHTGARGLTAEEAIAGLTRSRRTTDTGRRPAGAVWLIAGADVRAQTRAWQFPQAVEELKSMGMEAVVASQPPAARVPVAGLLMGAAEVRPAAYGALQAGAYADHLTSWAAEYSNPRQTKAVEWLRAGAAGSSGAVTEPMSIWTKFPAARLFAHQAAGCTLLEALIQAVASPLQLQLVGDPLSAPWAPVLRVTLTETRDGETRRFSARLDSPSGTPPADWLFLVDGRAVGPLGDPQLIIPSGALPDGAHVLRAVAYVRAPVRHQAFAETEIFVEGPRTVELAAPAAGPLDIHHALRVGAAVRGAAVPAQLAVARGPAVVAATNAARRAEWTLDPARLGAGPVEIRAAAIWPDGAITRSRAVNLVFEPRNRPPRVESATWTPLSGAKTNLTVAVRDPESDPVDVEVFAPLWSRSGLLSDGLPDGVETDGGKAVVQDRNLRLTASEAAAYAVCAWPAAVRTEEVTAQAVVAPDGAEPPARGLAALVYQYQDEKNFRFFGVLADQSAWCLGFCKDGVLRYQRTRGAPLCAGIPVRLTLCAQPGKPLTARVGDEVVFTQKPATSSGLGRVGFAGGVGRAEFSDGARKLAGAASSNGIATVTWPDADALSGEPWRLRARDGRTETWSEVSARGPLP